MPRKVLPYNPKLKELARQLRKSGTKSEIALWQRIKGKNMMGYDFHRQKPIDNYILDFFCRELMLCIELDGITHHDEIVYQKDKLKTARLNELGISVMRFNDYEVLTDMENVIRAIEGYAEVFNTREKTHP